VWCGLTLAFQGPAQGVPLTPDLNRKVEHEEVPRDEAANPGRYTPQEETVWVRDPNGPDRLVPKTEDGQPVVKENDAIKEIATVTGLNVRQPDDPLGFLRNTAVGERVRQVGTPNGPGWLSIIGVLGLFIAFGHSVLAMSGEETLAQVYREVESPKL